MTGICIAARRCANYDHHAGHAAFTEHSLCPDCLRVGQRATQQLLLDYRDLENHIPPGVGQRLDGQPGRSGEAPIPIRTDVEALQRAIWWVTTTWAEILADHDGLSAISKRTRDGYAVQWACGIIAPRIDRLAAVGPQDLADYPLTDEDEAVRYRSLALVTVTGAEGILDLTWLHRRAHSMLGLTELTKRLPGYCAWCARPDLTQKNGSDQVDCGSCGHAETRDDYDKRVNVLTRGRA